MNYIYEKVTVSPTSMLSAFPYLPPKPLGQPGDRLRVKFLGFDHIGTLAHDGRIYAASRKSGKVSIVTPEQFSGGREILNDGQIGSCSKVFANYKAVLGEPYDLLSANCEHYDNWARGLGWKSEQADRAKELALLGLACCVAYKSIQSVKR